MRKLKKIIKFGFLLGILIFVGVLGADWLVSHSVQGRLYHSTNEIKYNKVGMLLGTGKYLSSGHINLYYRYRIEAAAALYAAGKIDYLLVSGDNSRKDYDEPSAMKDDLMKAGIPSDRIYLDYAGFRTYDSVIRCKEVFGQSGITVISQAFHNERAVFIAQHKGVDAVAFNARDVDVRYGFKTRLREKLARVKVILDLVFGKNPKYLGEKIEIGMTE